MTTPNGTPQRLCLVQGIGFSYGMFSGTLGKVRPLWDGPRGMFRLGRAHAQDLQARNLTPSCDHPPIRRRQQLQETPQAAALGVELADVEVRDGDYVPAFAVLAARRPAALVVGAHNFFVRDRAQFIALAAQHKQSLVLRADEVIE